MSARLTSRMLVDLLIRAAGAAGGNAAVLAKGDDGAGAILIQCAERGRPTALIERRFDYATERYGWARIGAENIDIIDDNHDYLARRRARDPDLWLLELDIADAERFAAETIADG